MTNLSIEAGVEVEAGLFQKLGWKVCLDRIASINVSVAPSPFHLLVVLSMSKKRVHVG
jgi:hypothetical protein